VTDTGTVAAGPGLASRVTFTRGQGVAAAPTQAHTARPRPRPQAARPRPQAARSLEDRITRASDTHAAPAVPPAVAKDPDDAFMDDFDFSTARPTDTQASAPFCGPQPTQVSPLAATSSFQAHAATSPRRPIRMHNTPSSAYRGTNPIKRAVTNPRLRAVLAGKPVPRERKKYVTERMELRMGIGGGSSK
jgi:hypothetical protein